MSEELKSCPACGGQAVISSCDDKDKISCTKCQLKITRPSGGMHEAIAAWNALPRALVWSTEQPKLGGFYWARRKNTSTVHVVRVMEIREELSVFMPGSEVDGYLHWYTEWAEGVQNFV